MDRGTVGSASRGRLLVEIRHHGASAVVTPAGELDHHTADLLREPLEGCVDDGYARLVVDCSRALSSVTPPVSMCCSAPA